MAMQSGDLPEARRQAAERDSDEEDLPLAAPPTRRLCERRLELVSADDTLGNQDLAQTFPHVPPARAALADVPYRFSATVATHPAPERATVHTSPERARPVFSPGPGPAIQVGFVLT